MRVVRLSPDDGAALVDRLATHDSMRALPREERQWLVANGELRLYDAGEKVLAAGDEAQELTIVLSGGLAVYFGHGGGRRHVMQSGPGSLTGILPYSRLKQPQWDVMIEAPTELLMIHKSRFPEMIRECSVLTESLVHAMLDRARGFAAANWEDEKVTALGRLAAGLSHELNNPAAAAASGARRLTGVLAEVSEAARALGAASLTDEQLALVNDLSDRCRHPDRSVTLGVLERAELEDHMSEWLYRQGLDVQYAATLVDVGAGVEDLQSLASQIGEAPLAAVVRCIAAVAVGAALAADVEHATRRINDLVTAVRGYTHMDRAPVREGMDIAGGLAHTVQVMRAEANRKGATLRLDLAPELPLVSAVAPDLNQVWANLLQNALDAVPASGEVTVSARAEKGAVVVRVTDDGSGIAPEVQPRIFDPFFTTKPEGQGVGLGLDMVRRIVRSHQGDVEFESGPGRTEFRVRLPVAPT
jgi:signal transduction histidine kinase